ncbi:MAG: transaldolase [Nitrospiraceae bacterium]|nr:transaldolase [Nitrospiraceae bacterium]
MRAKEGNPLLELARAGQSIWLDYLGRDLIVSGELKRLIAEAGLTGVTSNPTIFQKAISGSKAYENSMEDMLSRNISDTKELFLGYAMEDVHAASNLLMPVYEASGGQDGFVSIEVSPDLAYDTEATIKEARRLFSQLGRKNVLVKVPGTRQGLPAIEQLISEGVNVNVTLLFSVERYKEVMDAYMKGLERRIAAGSPVNEVFSVASFFVSRIDTMVDNMLEELYEESDVNAKELLKGFFGRAAAASAKLAYRQYRDTFSAPGFQALRAKGARAQKILWASTSTKNPAYSDVKYVEELVAPDSINTMPENTLKAFRDHGKVRVTIGDYVEEAETLFADLRDSGIDIDSVTAELESEGVRLFSESFFSLLDAIAQQRDDFLVKRAH